MLPLCLATPAKAQVSAGASLDSDYRFHGISLSDSQPAATFSLAYDHSGGVNLGGSIIDQDPPHEGPQNRSALVLSASYFF